MNFYLAEPFLKQYFLIDAILGDLIDDKCRLKIFNELARLFYIPENAAKELYKASNEEPFYNIRDLAAYERLCRTIEFAGVEPDTTDRVILSQKREAMQVKDTISCEKNMTENRIGECLDETAVNGNIDAMLMLSFLEYHGICLCRDREGAIRRVRLCAKWNSIFGNLMAIAYDSGDEFYYNNLYTILDSANQREVFKYICKVSGYTRTWVKNPVARTLETAFAMGLINRNRYDRNVAKIAFSALISNEDKAKLLLEKREMPMGGIPFDATEKPFEFTGEIDAINGREAEREGVMCALMPLSCGKAELYRPLFVESGDGYVSGMYYRAISEILPNTVEVDAAALTMRDLVGTEQHFILRGLSEAKAINTVFLIKNCHLLGEDELEEMMRLTQPHYRGKFKLLTPAISIDLSRVVLVLFSAERIKSLEDCCEVVRPRPVTKGEKTEMIDNAFSKRTVDFGRELTMTDSVREKLAFYDAEQIYRIIDSTVKRAIYRNKSIVDDSDLQEVLVSGGVPMKEREFGYFGGVYEKN